MKDKMKFKISSGERRRKAYCITGLGFFWKETIFGNHDIQKVVSRLIDAKHEVRDSIGPRVLSLREISTSQWKRLRSSKVISRQLPDSLTENILKMTVRRCERCDWCARPIERRPSNCPGCDDRSTRQSGLPSQGRIMKKVSCHPTCKTKDNVQLALELAGNCWSEAFAQLQMKAKCNVRSILTDCFQYTVNTSPRIRTSTENNHWYLITVAYPLQMRPLYHADQLEADENNDVLLTCRVRGRPTPLISWYHNDTEIKAPWKPGSRYGIIQQSQAMETTLFKGHLNCGCFSICEDAMRNVVKSNARDTRKTDE
ncbi:hypothetical protein CLF_106970 [Clonorchis sinensis]|uniref:Ig-like domain-containing protein n=1 Tax=Clonorchis sinensis TaxID=79923 RepID=G7YG07_CLOSI|nr:hypothetical protein CLF_106970 [Clonorchis sinensis]